MTVELIADIAKLLLIVVCLQLTLQTYLRHMHPTWVAPVEKRRVAILLILVLAVLAAKVSEDVLGGESGVVDKTILLFIHKHVPRKLTDFFALATLTGSSKFLLPLTAACVIALLYVKRRLEALLLVASALSASLVVYVVKSVVGRSRPTLWETEWYWGSSFPSGHTLVVAALATAMVLCVHRIWPAARVFALATAIFWIFCVALSRLVLGVHWPTDVLAAACIGAILPLVMSVAFELLHVKR